MMSNFGGSYAQTIILVYDMNNLIWEHTYLSPYFTQALERCYPGGGALCLPSLFFSFGATKSPKLNLGIFLALTRLERLES